MLSSRQSALLLLLKSTPILAKRERSSHPKAETRKHEVESDTGKAVTPILTTRESNEHANAVLGAQLIQIHCDYYYCSNGFHFKFKYIVILINLFQIQIYRYFRETGMCVCVWKSLEQESAI